MMKVEAELRTKIRVVIEIELPSDHKEIIKAYRRKIAGVVLEEMGGNKKKARELLGLSRVQLWRWMKVRE